MIHTDQCEAPPPISSLVGGIVDDTRDLIHQELSLARQEIREAIGHAKMVLIAIVLGAMAILFASVLVALACVHLLYWLTNGQLALWGCYAIVAGLVALGGAVLLLAGGKKVQAVRQVWREGIEAMKEGIPTWNLKRK